jgi:hypothetical protein
MVSKRTPTLFACLRPDWVTSLMSPLEAACNQALQLSRPRQPALATRLGVKEITNT